MPGHYKDEGIVLKAIKLGEADRIVTFFTRHHGKVAAVAKGIRKTKSRFGGRLEPFTRVDLMLYRGRSLDTITSVDIVESFKGVRDHYETLTAAASLAELVDKVTPDRERALPVYALLVSGLEALAAGESTTVVPAFYVKLLSVSGYHPQLRVCAGCGSHDALAGFSAPLGGVICESCLNEEEDAVGLSSDRIATLNRLLGSELGQPGGLDETIQLTRLLRRYAEYHLERPMRSLEASGSEPRMRRHVGSVPAPSPQAALSLDEPDPAAPSGAR